MDVMTDVLHTMRLRGTAYFHAVFRAPWGMDLNGGSVANFHLVTEGRCWVQARAPDGGFWLNEGDVVVFPHGHAHSLGANPASETVPAAELMVRLGTHAHVAHGACGGTTECTRLVCGHFERSPHSRHPLLSSLPAMMHIRGRRDGAAPWQRAATDLADPVEPTVAVGHAAVADRLAEILLIRVLDAWVLQEGLTDGFIGALRDPRLCPVLEAIHSEPDRSWTLEILAKRAGMSRSTLSSRFQRSLGVPPMKYLTSWRLERARAALSSGEASIARVARSSGYADEFSFSRAFKREFGVSPSTVRPESS